MIKENIFMSKIIFILIGLYCVASVNCFGAVDLNDINVKEAVVGNTEFAFDLYSKLKDITPKENLFFSPYSLSTALAMTYGGARGNTEKQMAKALHFTLPNQRLYPAFGTLQKQLIKDDKSCGYQLLLANALWGQKGEPILQEFLDLNKNYYDAGLTLLDFRNEIEKSRQTINNWVEEKTEEKIKDLIPPRGMSPDTTLVLTNAIYFKGEWQNKFRWWKTRRADFNVSDKEKVEVRMMHIKAYFKFGGNAKMKIVELPYKDEELSMLVFLPREIKEFEETLTAESIDALLSERMKLTEVDVYLPRFKITWGSFSLNNALVALGMPDAFNPKRADFSGINGIGGIWVSDVFHQACIEVNEKGTEASGGSGLGLTQGRTPVFRADRPFIFIIKDNRSGSILFMGRVMNPAEES
jgi:serpin B